MSAVNILLGDFFNGADIARWRPDAGEPVVLAVGDEVLVNICEDETGTAVHFYSATGYAPPDLAVGAPCARENGMPGVHSRAFCHDGSKLVMLLRTMPRASLDSVSFREQLEHHVADCRAWAAVLLSAPANQQTDASPVSPTPPHVLA
ncbi:MAG: hypothetical protein ABIR26_03190 [Ramlibacter sp.]